MTLKKANKLKMNVDDIDRTLKSNFRLNATSFSSLAVCFHINLSVSLNLSLSFTFLPISACHT